MKHFKNTVAAITGAASGMGRSLALNLAGQGCHLALSDVNEKGLAETAAMAAKLGVKVTTQKLDVSNREAMDAWAAQVVQDHGRVNLIFNNAGVALGAFIESVTPAEFEWIMGINFWGVVWGTQAFLPYLKQSGEGHIINTSSVNGIWATIGPNTSHTAYAAAKFAVKGFTEALVTDLRLTAPHVKASVVMPGHIGTAIVANSRKVQGNTESDDLTPEELAATRHRMVAAGMDLSDVPDAAIQAMVAEGARRFEQDAPMTAAAAATVILDGVKAETWRILVGDDARLLDEWVRKDPEQAYEPAFNDAFVKAVGWKLGW